MTEDSIKAIVNEISDSFQLKKFLDGIDMGAYLVDKDRTILYWNKAAQRITGYTPEDVIGKSCKDNILAHTDSMGVPLCQTELCPLIRSMKTQKTAFVPFAAYAKNKKKKSRIPLNIFSFPLSIPDMPYVGLEFFQVSMEADELVRAMNIQKNLLPKNLPEDFRIFYHPSSFLSGDMIFSTPPFFGLVDVSGHGVSSALISTSLRLLINDLTSRDINLKTFGDKLEKQYKQLQVTDKYFTGIFGKKEGDMVSLISFGHPKPIIIREDGEVEEIKIKNDTPIGFNFPHFANPVCFSLKENETLFIFSDGLPEIRTRSGLLDTNGVFELLKETQDPNKIYEKAMEKSTEIVQSDDISMLMIGANIGAEEGVR